MASGLRIALAVVMTFALSSLGDDPVIPGPLEPPGREDFLSIPIRLHVLTAPGLPDVDCHLTDADLRRVLGKVNGIWHQAGVHWSLDALIFEPANRPEGNRGAVEADEGSALRGLAPGDRRSTEGADVYYIHRFSVNGVYLGDRMAFVQETAALRKVPGGIDEPLPRVTAHELGHLLGLEHRQDRTNLLASGNNGTTLNPAEVARARRVARKVPGVRTLPELRIQADAALAKGEDAQARKFLTLLVEIPGEGIDDARKKLEALPVVDREPAASKPTSP